MEFNNQPAMTEIVVYADVQELEAKLEGGYDFIRNKYSMTKLIHVERFDKNKEE